MADKTLDFPVTLPIDLPAFLLMLEGALEAARAEGNTEVEGLDMSFFLDRVRTVYITSALKQVNGNLSMAAELLGLEVEELVHTRHSPALC